MAENSNIEWTDHTFNPWMGCTKVSAGCAHCYAEAMMDTRLGKVEWGPGGMRKRTSPDNWRKPLQWASSALDTYGRRARVFCASLADVGEDRPELEPIRDDLCDLILRTCDRLEWQLLTKRPENMPRLFPEEVLLRCGVMTSVEDQPSADTRIPRLLECPAAWRGLSMEPLLGPVDLDPIGCEYCDTTDNWDISGSVGACNDCGHEVGSFRRWLMGGYVGIDWVIVGGESGPGARPMHPDWVRSIRDQCAEAAVPFFFKQWGAWVPFFVAQNEVDARRLTRGRDGGQWHECIEADGGACVGCDGDFSYPVYQMRRVGKKAAGRELDGVTHDAMPGHFVNANEPAGGGG